VSVLPERILIVRMSAMGDVIHALPAVAALGAALPRAQIGWLVEERWSELLCAGGEPKRGPRSTRRPLIDSLHIANTKRWRKALFANETRQEFASLISELRSAKYDAVIDFQGLIRSALFGWLSGANVRYGFVHPRESAARWFYTTAGSRAGTHVIEQNLALAQAFANKPLANLEVQFPHDASAERNVDNELAKRGLNAFAILNPGAGWGAKRWPAQRFAELAVRLKQSHGINSLINFGPGEEHLARTVEASSNSTAAGVSLSLSELIAFTRRAQLFVGGDTGPMHLAAALNIPTVALFGPTDPARNGPFTAYSATLRDAASVTSHSRSDDPDPGLLRITVDQVADAARTLLERRP
jgi:heptosyltransferase I